MFKQNRLYNVYFLHNGVYNFESLLDYPYFIISKSKTDAKILQKIPEGATHFRAMGKIDDISFKRFLPEFKNPMITIYNNDKKILKKYIFRTKQFLTKNIEIPESAIYMNITEWKNRKIWKWKKLTYQ